MPAPTINLAEAIDLLAEDCAQMSEAKGFWDPDDIGSMGIIPLKLALVVSEAAEALDVHRKKYDDSEALSGMTTMQWEDFTEEIADIVIRVFDIAGFYDLDLGNSIISKMEKNHGRPYRHSKRY